MPLPLWIGALLSTFVLFILFALLRYERNDATMYIACGVYVVWNVMWYLYHRSNADPRGEGVCTDHSENVERCPICLDQPSSGYVFRTPCGHEFCPECMAQWLTVAPTCPVCRERVKRHRFNCPGCTTHHRKSDVGRFASDRCASLSEEEAETPQLRNAPR